MMTPRRRDVAGTAAGFSLIELMVSMGILTVGVLSLAGALTAGVRAISGSSARLIAREKAREAIESVHAARDTGQLSWNNIRNVPDGGIFLSGPQPLRQAGADGIVNTADDTSAQYETQRSPGADGILGNGDDVIASLGDSGGQPNPSLRQITVSIHYLVEGTWRNYQIRTYISSFS
jgi:prepilin-type N-terminal cleavage/methylation domain-containing protein